MAGLGNDTIDWSESAQANGTYDLLFGLATAGAQNESMSSFENFIGTKQNDTIIEGFLTNSTAGGGGDDLVITGATLSTSYDGGDGTDRIDWQNLQVQNVTFDLQAGTASAIRGLPATMTNFENLIGSGFSDTVRGTSQNNDIQGMAGDDTIFGRAGSDVVHGGAGNDQIRGNGGRDMFFGGAGNDNIRGGGGNDFLSDGDGMDRLQGQNGNDVFSFNVDGFVDRIRDFTLGEDLIELSGFAFDDLTISDMASGNIRVLYGTDSLIIRDSADLLSASDLTSSDFLFA